MDSHEERLHLMIEQSKINEAKEIAKKKQKELLQSRIKDKLENAKEEAMGRMASSSDGKDISQRLSVGGLPPAIF